MGTSYKLLISQFLNEFVEFALANIIVTSQDEYNGLNGTERPVDHFHLLPWGST